MDEHELMGSMKISKAVAKMAVPSVISSLVTVLYNMADTFFCRTDGRSASGGGGEPDESDFYFNDGFCQYVRYGRQRRSLYGAGREE